MGERARPRAGDVEDQQILHRRRAQLARAEALGQVGHRAHLGRREAAAEHRQADVAPVLLALGMDADVIAIDVVGRLVVDAGRQPEADPLLQRGEKPERRPALVEEQKLQPRLLPALPQHVAVPEDLRDAADHRQHLAPAHEGVERPGEVRVGGQPAADAHGEPDLPGGGVAHGREADVVDLGIDAPAPAARDRDLVLARQVVEVGVAVQHARGAMHER